MKVPAVQASGKLGNALLVANRIPVEIKTNRRDAVSAIRKRPVKSTRAEASTQEGLRFPASHQRTVLLPSEVQISLSHQGVMVEFASIFFAIASGSYERI